MQHEWPVAFFDDDYLRIYRPTFTPERTAAEVDFIEQALEVPRGGAVLDLACGYGRHAIALALRGHRVTGLDFNAHYLDIAAEEGRAAGAQIEWRQGDMRALPFDREFASVYSFFTSFGYYDDDENEQVLAGIARALQPGGRFLIEMLNRDWLLTHPQQLVWTQQEDGSFLMEETIIELAASRVITRQTLINPTGGPKVNKEYALRAYTCAELTSLLRRHDLHVIATWGGIQREPYSTESRRLALLCERKA